ncbi:MAG: cation:proton antiporter, partial [Ktedonobacterales bacterium]|nr:cation:proton antiporter [Ktedonobacterales bacterium]
FGELELGLALGPFIANMIPGSFFGTLGDIGVILLMLLVGMETDLSALKGIGVSAFLVACCGALLPFVAGGALAYELGMPINVALVIGVALSATSVSITAATLREMGKAQSQVGRTILMAAVIDDVLGLLLLTVVTGQQSGTAPSEALLRVGMIIVITLVAGWLLTPVLRYFAKRHVEDFLAVAVGVGFLFAWSAQVVGGLAPITGAYVAGLVLARSAPHERVIQGIETLASGFFATIFFVSLGLNVHITDINLSWLGLFLGLAILTKVIGCGFGAKISHLGWGDSLAVGIGMIPRGEVALIVASIGFNAHILSSSIFAMVVVLSVATTLVTPLLLKGIFTVQARRSRASAMPGEAVVAVGFIAPEWELIGEEAE